MTILYPDLCYKGTALYNYDINLREVSNRYTCISHKEKDCLKEYVIPVFFLLNILVICGQKTMHYHK